MGNSVLDHLAQAAAVIVLIELLVVVLIFAGVSGGLVFGLRWVTGKTDWAAAKLRSFSALGARYVHLGTDYAARPFFLLGRVAGTVEGTALAVQREARRLHALHPVVPAQSVPAAEPASTDVSETEPAPLV